MASSEQADASIRKMEEALVEHRLVLKHNAALRDELKALKHKHQSELETLNSELAQANEKRQLFSDQLQYALVEMTKLRRERDTYRQRLENFRQMTSALLSSQAAGTLGGADGGALEDILSEELQEEKQRIAAAAAASSGKGRQSGSDGDTAGAAALAKDKKDKDGGKSKSKSKMAWDSSSDSRSDSSSSSSSDDDQEEGRGRKSKKAAASSSSSSSSSSVSAFRLSFVSLFCGAFLFILHLAFFHSRRSFFTSSSPLFAFLPLASSSVLLPSAVRSQASCRQRQGRRRE